MTLMLRILTWKMIYLFHFVRVNDLKHLLLVMNITYAKPDSDTTHNTTPEIRLHLDPSALQIRYVSSSGSGSTFYLPLGNPLLSD